jgi:hypothetical protein
MALADRAHAFEELDNVFAFHVPPKRGIYHPRAGVA